MVGPVGGGECVVGAIGLRVDGEKDFSWSNGLGGYIQPGLKESD